MKGRRKKFSSESAHLAVKMEPELLRALQAVADRQERTPAGQARWIIKLYIEQQDKEHSNDTTITP